MAFVAPSNSLRACPTTEGRFKGDQAPGPVPAPAPAPAPATAERKVDDASSADHERWEMGQTAYVNYPPDKVWELMEDFVAIDRWHPSVVSSVLSSGEPQQPGVVRYVVTKAGDTLYEMLTHLDTEQHEMSYTVLENTFGLVDYHSQIRVRTGARPGTTVITWNANMSPSPIKTRDQIFDLLGGGLLRSGEKITKILSLAAAAPSAEAKGESLPVAAAAGGGASSEAKSESLPVAPAAGGAPSTAADASSHSLQLPSTNSN